MDAREIIKAKLAELDVVPTEADLDELVPAYHSLQRWEKVLEGMLRTKPTSRGMEWPLSEPALIHDLERYR